MRWSASDYSGKAIESSETCDACLKAAVLILLFSFPSRALLDEAYGGKGMVVLDCRGGVYINQVILCLEHNSVTGLPGGQASTLSILALLIVTFYPRSRQCTGDYPANAHKARTLKS